MVQDFKLSPSCCLTSPKWARDTMNYLVTWNCLRRKGLNCSQLVIDRGVNDLNHFLALLLRVTTKTLYLAKYDTMYNSIKSLKWSKWSCGSAFPSYALIFGSLNPLRSGASRVYLLKDEPFAAAASSSSYSSITTMAHHKSSKEIFLIPCKFTLKCTLYVLECC